MRLNEIQASFYWERIVQKKIIDIRKMELEKLSTGLCQCFPLKVILTQHLTWTAHNTCSQQNSLHLPLSKNPSKPKRLQHKKSYSAHKGHNPWDFAPCLDVHFWLSSGQAAPEWVCLLITIHNLIRTDSIAFSYTGAPYNSVRGPPHSVSGSLLGKCHRKGRSIYEH